MLAMASPRSTASTPCTRLHSSVHISNLDKPSSCHISLKSHFTPKFQVAENRIVAKAPCRSSKIMHIRCEEIYAPGAEEMYIPEEFRQIYEEIEKLGPAILDKTWYPKGVDSDNTKKTWYIVDATDKVLGRLASTIAIHIRGKNLPTFTPSVDMGAYVIVTNAEKIAVSGKKRTQKLYRRHSGRPGGLKEETFDQLQKRIPERIIEHAVRGMLPKGRLGRRLFTHLKVYKGPDHPHVAQKPVPLPIMDKRIMIKK
uniref:Large ribosomal subunit protein uL13c n=1 Tax=Araucaria cunninghamii TaxID=56994 RepID=A0A0D6R6B9_ARACU